MDSYDATQHTTERTTECAAVITAFDASISPTHITAVNAAIDSTLCHSQRAAQRKSINATFDPAHHTAFDSAIKSA